MRLLDSIPSGTCAAETSPVIARHPSIHPSLIPIFATPPTHSHYRRHQGIRILTTIGPSLRPVPVVRYLSFCFRSCYPKFTVGDDRMTNGMTNRLSIRHPKRCSLALIVEAFICQPLGDGAGVDTIRLRLRYVTHSSIYPCMHTKIYLLPSWGRTIPAESMTDMSVGTSGSAYVRLGRRGWRLWQWVRSKRFAYGESIG
ncbi:hypothetical protein DFP72DRAFT_513657 [Ephemerocybe angulata]|uniref:Uncharacterized protein n=1 Tax=Ephemerocybe angulata TaxID=980116 RepID=A0A8H6HPP2_9AGAR|nr:hypothetical protein DFP72DRAFT_513657 [Tulosesus angulatus]